MTRRRLRVLFVTHGFPRHAGDAAGAFVHALARAVSAYDVEVDVLAPSAPGLARAEAIDGVRVQRYRYAPSSWETLAYAGTMAEQVAGSIRGKLGLALLLWRGRRAVRAAIARYRPDLIHAHWWFPSGLIAAGLGVPLVITSHGSDVRLARGTQAGVLLRRTAALTRAWYAVSGWLAREASTALGGRAVEVAPMPAAVELFAPPSVPRDAQRMLFVGRLNAQKGLADLLTAMSQSKRPWVLDVVGDGPDREPLQRRAVALGLADRVQWLGHQPQPALAALYGRAAALVVPSIDEGLGLVGVEAALCETPVVAYASGGLTDVVKDGATGWLVPPGDIAALAHAIDGVVERPARAREFGVAGRAWAIATFSPAAVGARYRAAYDAALGAE